MPAIHDGGTCGSRPPTGRRCANHQRHDRDWGRFGARGRVHDDDRLVGGTAPVAVPPGPMEGPPGEGRRPRIARGERIPGGSVDRVDGSSERDQARIGGGWSGGWGLGRAPRTGGLHLGCGAGHDREDSTDAFGGCCAGKGPPAGGGGSAGGGRGLPAQLLDRRSIGAAAQPPGEPQGEADHEQDRGPDRRAPGVVRAQRVRGQHDEWREEQDGPPASDPRAAGVRRRRQARRSARASGRRAG